MTMNYLFDYADVQPVGSEGQLYVELIACWKQDRIQDSRIWNIWALYLVFHINSQISSYKCFTESKLLKTAIV